MTWKHKGGFGAEVARVTTKPIPGACQLSYESKFPAEETGVKSLQWVRA